MVSICSAFFVNRLRQRLQFNFECEWLPADARLTVGNELGTADLTTNSTLRRSEVKVTPAAIIDVLILEPRIFGDARGFFYESFNQRSFQAATGLNPTFVQDNHSCSVKGVLRGLHYQLQQVQAKLVRVVRGEIFDVAVDLRNSSPTFGRWIGEVLSAENRRQLWIPAGFAHGFLALSEEAEVLYKTTDFFAPNHERCIAWNDLQLAIDWPLAESPVLSAKDKGGVSLNNAEVFA
jgi:dTDP-4-dehydrorhamnose 3,5-epimerase